MCEYLECRVPAESGEQLCILHLDLPKNVDRFKEALYQQIDEAGPEGTRNPRFWFAGYRFPVGIVVTEHSERSAAEWIILPRQVEGDISFDGAEVHGEVVFNDAVINGNASFIGTMIEKDAQFFKALIEGHLDLGGVTIHGDCFLVSGIFKHGVSFYRPADEPTKFYVATVEGSLLLDRATITGSLNLAHATIRNDGWLEAVTIGGNLWAPGTKIGRVLNLNDAVINGVLELSGATLGDAGMFHRVSCYSLSLGRNNPRIRGWGNDRCGIHICQPDTAVPFWRFAQTAFARMGDRERADVSFYFERVAKWRVSRRGSILSRLLWLGDCLFLRWTSAYGASIARLFTTWFIVISGFGIAFSMNPFLIGQRGASIGSFRTWISGIHYSVTTFATLGLGDLTPGVSSLGKVLTSIEALLGALLIALAVLVIGRRFMRQG